MADLSPEPLFYLINGVPFSGTGFGYNPVTGQLDAVDVNNYSVALQPQAIDNRDPPGGANEDYDAADYQNMIMATPTLPTAIGLTNIPSLHRPALVNYWFYQIVQRFQINWNYCRTTALGRHSSPSIPVKLHPGRGRLYKKFQAENFAAHHC